MKIGISTSVIQRGKTGVAQHIFALTKAFASLEINYPFLLFVLEEDIPLFGYLNGQFEIIPVAEKFRPPIKNILWHQSILPALARKHAVDLIHIPSYRRLVASGVCPRVATIHDLAPFHVAGKYDLARMLYGRVLVKYLARRQDHIITVSENTAQDVRRFFGIPNEKISVIHNGLDHDRFFPAPRRAAREDTERKYKITEPFFLYVARLEHPGKNHVRLIEAFDRFKLSTKSNWQLVLGGSDWHGAEAIHARIKNSPYRDEIKSLGFISDLDLPDLYRAADVFVYPSLFEGFGLPPLEAMACAIPVICSAKGALGEVVADAARIIDPENIDDISSALQDFATNESLRSNYVRSGLARAQQFNWKTAATQTLAVYRAAAEKFPLRRPTVSKNLLQSAS